MFGGLDKTDVRAHEGSSMPLRGVMCFIAAFTQMFDGFSIGSNDLARLVLGIDRDSDIVAFDERGPGTLAIIARAIKGAKRNGRHIGIYGQAASDHSEIAASVVEAGIGLNSLYADRVLRTAHLVVELGRSLNRASRH